MTAQPHAFSLLELLITLSILSVTAAFTLPSWQALQERQLAQLQLNELQETLYYAREQAILTEKYVTVCPTENGHTCSSNWHFGYMVVFAPTENETGNISQHPLRLHQYAFIPLTYRGFPQSRSICFTPEGFTHHQNGTFTYQTPTMAHPLQLVISPYGHIWQKQSPP